MAQLNRRGHVATSDQAYTGNYNTPQKLVHHPFGEIGYTHIEKRHRDGSLGETKTLTIYLINERLNPLVNKFVDQPDADMLLFC